jgi:hypothetical protein
MFINRRYFRVNPTRVRLGMLKSILSMLFCTHNFTPNYDSLLLAALVNAPLDPQGVTLTLYSQSSSNATVPNNFVAIDSVGRVLLVPPEDGLGIVALARQSLELSPTNGWINTWFVKQETTCPVLDRLWILPRNSARGHVRRLRSAGVLKKQPGAKDASEWSSSVAGHIVGAYGACG